MFEGAKKFLRERRLQVRDEEVLERLSYNIWKTRNRILDEIIVERMKRGEAPPVPTNEAQWYPPRVDTTIILSRFVLQDIVARKCESDFTRADITWAAKSDTGSDEEYARRREARGNGEIPFYRLIGNSGKRKLEEDKLAGNVLDPAVIR